MSPHWIALLIPAALHAGPYAPGADSIATTAISKGDSRIVAWASGHSEVTYGTDVDNIWRTPAKATGPATDDMFDIVCLGNGGRITMHFPHPLRDGQGPDFAVFENSFSHMFLELAFVEVSSDGVNFFRFPNASLTPSPIGPFAADIMDPTNIDGLAGKYKGGYGTPFDLAAIPDSPLLDKQRVPFVRVVDIVGDGRSKDSSGRAIYDPYPVIGSGGFDLEAIGAIHINDGAFRMLKFSITGNTAALEWESNPGHSYRIETGTRLDDWQVTETITARTNRGTTLRNVTVTSGPTRFWRIVRSTP